ncbi:hypothetical protein [uncultured Litoreibacter sp.]|uniref:hypothetical protein n=1 Tax=uncultured Litoreibacter sp. TaxID=1392394 RepID=UPI00261B0647|nr:hypothetical protein [uncultured Litoreibacter sp.]
MSVIVDFGAGNGQTNAATTGPMVREAQRHLAQWTLQPICALLAEEAATKLGSPVKIDIMRPLQAFDAGGRARELKGIIQALAVAKEAGVDADKAMQLGLMSEDQHSTTSEMLLER